MKIAQFSKYLFSISNLIILWLKYLSLKSYCDTMEGLD